MSAARPFGPLQWAIVALTIATAVIHLWLAFQFPGQPDRVFILNGIGYLALLALLMLPVPALQRYHGWIAWILIAYTAITVVGWVFLGVGSPLSGVAIDFGSPLTWLAYVDKLIELALIGCLWLDWQRRRTPVARS